MAILNFFTISRSQALAATSADDVVVDGFSANQTTVTYNPATDAGPANVAVTLDATTVVFGAAITGGDDVFAFSDGSQLYIGGESGSDVASTASGDDALFGLGGDDALNGGLGDDVLQGNAGSDSLTGGRGADTVYGGQGDDVIVATAGETDANFVQGNKGDDTIEGGQQADTLLGGQGDDTIHGNDGGGYLSGDLGDDYIEDGAGRSSIFGGDGADTILGGEGNDTIEGGAGDDAIYFTDYVGAPSAYASGNDGDDYIEIGPGHVAHADGGAGDDTLRGGDATTDLLSLDALYGGPGYDLLHGGAGADVFFTMIGDSPNDGGLADRIDDWTSADALVFFHGFGGDGTSFNYREIVDSDVTSYFQALAAAEQALGESQYILYVAVQVGGDVLVFAHPDDLGGFQTVVQLTGVSAASISEANFSS